MRRADRLFQIVQFLRKRRRATTARVIADAFGICTRTVYRDIQALADSGVPVVGEAGVGYLLDRRYELPPLMFTLDEIEAIALGIRMVRTWTDDAFAGQAEAALNKVRAALPPELLERMRRQVMYALPGDGWVPSSVAFSDLRRAINARRKLAIAYRDLRGRDSRRTVRPLALVFFGTAWLLLAWCEKRRDFRNFRTDRLSDMTITEQVFEDADDKSLDAYLEQMSECDAAGGDPAHG